MKFPLIIGILFGLSSFYGHAQPGPVKGPPNGSAPGYTDRLSRSDTVPRGAAERKAYLQLPIRMGCKRYGLSWFLMTREYPLLKKLPPKKGPAKKPLLVVHGNILYDLNYWSNIDTPYSEKSVYQHTVQSYLDIDYKDNYPFRVFFTTRWSNSSLFRNFTDLNFLYNANDFNNRVRRQVQGLLQQSGQDSLQKMEKAMLAQEKDYNALKTWLNGPDQWQRLMAERERLWFKSQDSLKRAALSHSDSLKGPDSTRQGSTAQGPSGLPDLSQLGKYKFGSLHAPGHSADSGKAGTSNPDTAFVQRYDSLQKRLDSMGARLATLQQRYQQAKDLQSRNGNDTQKDLNSITSGSELKDKLDAQHVSDSSLPKGYRTLYSVRSFGIGRTMLDYSELSVKNISINGVELEYNPSSYMAIAAGTVDYRFQDYTLQNKAQGQYLGVIRYGWGKKDGNNVILTYYTGRRQLYNADTTIQGAPIPNYNLMGFTVAGRYQLGHNNALIAEVAKSSTPYYSLDSSQPHNVLASTVKLSDRSNEAYSLKFTSLIPRTQTRFAATWSRYGANFQSFSLFTSGSEQTAWSVKVDQPLFQRHLQVTGSIKTNDFINPLLSTSYKSTTVFESIQATLRLKNWPTLSVGYFPSSQIVKLSDNQYQENLFYTLTASATESYKVKTVSLVTLLLYTQFYNRVTDTGFVYYNTKNLMLSQSAFIGRLTLQMQLSAAMSTAYDLYVIDDKADYRFTSWLSLGAGLKYNIQTVYNIKQWGYSGSASIRVPKVGEFRMMEDKGFIPGNNKQLVVNKLGRLTYIKVF